MRHGAPWQFAITFILLMFGLVDIAYLLKQKGVIPDSELVLMGVVGGLGWLGYSLARRTAVVNVVIAVDDTGVRQTWEQQILFSNRPDIFISWEEIAEYVYETGGRTFHVFKIRLKNGTNWRLCRYLSLKKDDFDRFYNDFSARVEQFNAVNQSNGVMIREGKTSWERTPALVLSILLVIAMVALPIVMIMRPDMVGLGALGIIYPGGLILVIVIYMRRKKRREYEQSLSQRLPGES